MCHPRKDYRSTRCQSHHLSHHSTDGDTLWEGREAHNNGRHTFPCGASQIKDTTAGRQKVSIHCYVSCWCQREGTLEKKTTQFDFSCPFGGPQDGGDVATMPTSGPKKAGVM